MSRIKVLGIVGLVVVSMIFMGTEGCDQALENMQSDIEDLQTVGGDVDEELKELIEAGKVSMHRDENGNFIYVDEDGNEIVLEGKTEVTELEDESLLEGSGPSVGSPPVE